MNALKLNKLKTFLGQVQLKRNDPNPENPKPTTSAESNEVQMNEVQINEVQIIKAAPPMKRPAEPTTDREVQINEVQIIKAAPPMKRPAEPTTDKEVQIKKTKLPETFRDSSIVPTIEELKSDNSNHLQENIISGKFNSVDHYLETLFWLLREDFIRPLKEKIIQNKQGEVNEYENVEISNIQFTQDGAQHVLHFDQETFKSIKFENSTRLAFGSLLCLSKDNFETAIFATVVFTGPHDFAKGIIKVRLEGDFSPIQVTHGKYKAIEPQAFFEAYRHVLKGLQQTNINNLPLQKHLINIDNVLTPPLYLETNSFYRLKSDEVNDKDEKIEYRVEIADINSWPDAEKLNLDESQRKAMHLALTSSLAIIQGPPGTGKTHVGLKIVQTLLSNKHMWNHKMKPNPILVVCFTNHALDQFLEGISKFTQDIVRVGSRSTNKVLEPFLLRGLQRNRKIKKGKNYLNVKQEQMNIQKQVEVDMELLKFVDTRIVHENALEKSFVKDEMDLKLVKSLKLCNLQTQRSILGVWLGLIPSEIVSEEEVRNFYGDNANVMVNGSDENVIEIEESMWTIFSTDWAVALDFDEKTRENVNAVGSNVKIPLISTLGALRINVAKRESGKMDVMKDEEISRMSNVWSLELGLRWRLYRRWVQLFREKVNASIKKGIESYNEIVKILKKDGVVEQTEVIQRCDIVGMTTTGAARYRDILQTIGPKIVIVEEAAEVLESHIITCLSKSTEQLILIGDHQQLRPSVNVYDLARKYHLDVSLFERLINNNVPFETLQLQHRMRPEISSLLVPHIYKVLRDHPVVMSYPNVKGMTQNIFFLNHSEQGEVNATSHTNLFEAEFIINLCRYLVQQGYKTSQITILTPYSGQSALLRRIITPEINSVKIDAVDNFQGEENDIILLSFARSDENDRIGFLKVENRINVALSRAKIGLFCVGTFHHFAKRSLLWYNIVCDLTRREAFGPGLHLECQNHGKKTYVRSGQDISKNCPGGGCGNKCRSTLDCGHYCYAVCHPGEHPPCKELCKRKICNYGHTRCRLPCSEKCEPCKRLVPRKLYDCDHMVTVECHVNTNDIKCREQVMKTLKCGHAMKLECYQDPNEVLCVQLAPSTLKCGHVCVKICNETDYECDVLIDKKLRCGHMESVKCSEDITSVRCQKPCDGVLICGHHCPMKCSEPCGKCLQESKRELPCGHTMVMTCSVDSRTVACNEPCRGVLRCGHRCTLKCHEKCGPCLESVEKTLRCGHKMTLQCYSDVGRVVCNVPCERTLGCGHKMTLQCSTNVGRVFCNMPCEKTFRCGHKCGRKCKEMCGECTALVEKSLPCGHKKTVKCNFDLSRYVCSQPCMKKLYCGHQCPKKCCEKCGGCQGTAERKLSCGHTGILKCNDQGGGFKCPKECTKLLQCGHPCPKKCFEKCGGCPLKVEKELPCGHAGISKCCGGDLDCTKKCAKLLKCGHPCMKRCFEPCEEVCDKTAMVSSICGHEVEVPCQKQKSAARKIASFCTTPCRARLSCGHYCMGTCGNCRQGRVHVPCKQLCVEKLICGHKIEKICCAVYPPCQFEFPYACDHHHSVNRGKCSDRYLKCEVKCLSNCLHYTCRKDCWEICDKLRCFAPCSNKLKCGHPCLGVCGEKCPERFCKVCDEELSAKYPSDVMFYCLEDCEHSFEVEAFDSWMDSQAKVFGVKCCPTCGVVIRKSGRYGNVLKESLQLIENAKSKIEDKTYEFIRRRQKAIPECGRCRKVFPQVVAKLQNRLVNPTELSKVVLDLVVNQIEVLKLMTNVKLNCETLPEAAKNFVDDEMVFLSARIEESEKEMDKLDLNSMVKEVRRVELYAYKMYFEKFLGSKNERMKKLNEKLNEMLEGVKILSDDDEVIVSKSLQDMQRLCGFPDFVFKSFDKLNFVVVKELRGGCWFKADNCTNNHAYFLGEKTDEDQKICKECKSD